MAHSQEIQDKVKTLYDQLKLDLAAVMGRECDVVLLAHAKHVKDQQCDGMTLNVGDNADPVEVHRMSVHLIMWAQENLAYHEAMMHVPEGMKPN